MMRWYGTMRAEQETTQRYRIARITSGFKRRVNTRCIVAFEMKLLLLPGYGFSLGFSSGCLFIHIGFTGVVF